MFSGTVKQLASEATLKNKDKQMVEIPYQGRSMVVVDVETQSNIYPEHCPQEHISLGLFSGLRRDGNHATMNIMHAVLRVKLKTVLKTALCLKHYKFQIRSLNYYGPSVFWKCCLVI